MIMEWNDRDYRFDLDGENDGDSFSEYAERMKWSRRPHDDVVMTNSPRRDELALFESTGTLLVRLPLMETGGSRLPHHPAVWAALIPILKVARYKLSSN